MRVSVQMVIAESFYDDVLQAIMDGSSCYWINEGGYEITREGDTLFIVDTYNDSGYGKGKKCPIDRAMVELGFKRYIEWKSERSMTIYYEIEEIDDNEADIIFQLALFNEVIYG